MEFEISVANMDMKAWQNQNKFGHSRPLSISKIMPANKANKGCDIGVYTTGIKNQLPSKHNFFYCLNTEWQIQIQITLFTVGFKTDTYNINQWLFHLPTSTIYTTCIHHIYHINTSVKK